MNAHRRSGEQQQRREVRRLVSSLGDAAVRADRLGPVANKKEREALRRSLGDCLSQAKQLDSSSPAGAVEEDAVTQPLVRTGRRRWAAMWAVAISGTVIAGYAALFFQQEVTVLLTFIGFPLLAAVGIKRLASTGGTLAGAAILLILVQLLAFLGLVALLSHEIAWWDAAWRIVIAPFI